MEEAHLASAQKKAQREGRVIVFIDESGLSERPTRVRTWAPKGQTPVIPFHFNWKQRSMIAGVERSQRLFPAARGPHQKAAKARLRLQHSPEQIAALLPVSHETLYLRIYADKRQGGERWRNLRCQKQRRKRYASGRSRRGQIPNRRPIAKRPASVEGRRHVGHWEADTLIGAGGKQAIVSLVQRKSGDCLLAQVPQKASKAVKDAIVRALSPIKHRAKTLSFDNGLEFARHGKIDQALESSSYFADPYASRQRGTNENTNGLVRQDLPKPRPFNTVTDEEIAMIMDRLNHRPRKRLNWKTPHQSFMQSFNRVALRG